MDPYYLHTITFYKTVHREKKVKYWRMYGLGGEITSEAYLPTLFINLAL